MKESLWNGFKRLDFEFEGRESVLIIPEAPVATKSWLLKAEFFDVYPEFEIEMVKRGWHLAYIKNIHGWAAEEDLDLKKRFSDYLSAEFGLCKKCVPVGMSCGGLIGSMFAAKYPDYVAGLYLDAPVLNLLSCPAGIRNAVGEMEGYTEITGITLLDLMFYRNQPLDKMPILLENNIPIIVTHGDSDTSVPFEENTAFLEKYYRENNGIISVIIKENCGHHPHGPVDCAPVIEFVEKYCM